MESVEVCRSPCRIAENNPLPCEPKSHAARRRRMEIRKFKVIATSPIGKPTETPRKRIKFTILGRDFARDCVKCPELGSGRIQPQMRPRREAGLSAFPLTSEAKLQDVLSNEVVLQENRTAVVI